MSDSKAIIFPDGRKEFRSIDYNYNFNIDNGYFERWGECVEDDPKYSEYGPEILDIEVSTVCNGLYGKPCDHCYKSNGPRGKNMSFDTFKTILDKMPMALTQVAFGIGDLDANPDLFRMFEYCLEDTIRKVVPNLTINGFGLTDEKANNLSKYLGAVSVSRYNPKGVCYDAVQKLVKTGMKQVNIHIMVSSETMDDCFEVVDDYKNDARLAGMNAIVFLMLKPKGVRNTFNQPNFASYKKLVKTALSNGVKIGFDSCSAPLFLESIKDVPNFDEYDKVCESCESSLFSAYINVDGDYFPCSFAEGEYGIKGIDVAKCNNFKNDVWFNPNTVKFRRLLTNQKHSLSPSLRRCPIFTLYDSMDSENNYM